MGISHRPIKACEPRSAFTISRLWLKQVRIAWNLRASCPKLCVQKARIESPRQPTAVPAHEIRLAEMMCRGSDNNRRDGAQFTAGTDQLLTVISARPVSESKD